MLYTDFRCISLAGLVLKCSPPYVEKLQELPAPGGGAIWVALEGISDHMNLGSLLRSAAFFGVEGEDMSFIKHLIMLILHYAILYCNYAILYYICHVVLFYTTLYTVS